MAKKRKIRASREWKQALRTGVTIAGTIIVAFLIFKAGLNIGFQVGIRAKVQFIPKHETTIPLVLEYRQLRKDI